MKNSNLRRLIVLIYFILSGSCSSEDQAITPSGLIQYSLTITSSKGGSVSPEASGTYNKGVTITLTATPDKGYKFDRWEGSDFDDNVCNFSGPFNCRTAVTMDSNRDVKAYFIKASN